MAEGIKLGKWTMTKRIGDGASGTVWSVVDNNGAEGVVKIAKKPNRNMSIRWETTILSRMGKKGKDLNIVRLLDNGETTNDNGEVVVFMVMKKIEIETSYLLKRSDSGEQVLRLGMQLLKAVYDLHSEGILHRDLKPENMGLQRAGNADQYVLTLYDFGLARMFTDEQGELRTPRSWVGMRGTREWASSRAEQGREQTRIDDLWSWFYCMVEWFNSKSSVPLPWTFRGKLHRSWLKSSYAPVKHLTRNCPKTFVTIHAYLQMVRPDECPDYKYLAKMIIKSMDDIKNEEKKAKNENEEEII